MKIKINAAKTVKFLAVIFGAAAIATLTACFILAKNLPDSVHLIEGEKLSFESLPVKIQSKSVGFIEADKISKSGYHYTDELKLFGAVPIKNVDVTVVKENYVVPSGCAFGVKLYTAGVVVVRITDVTTQDGQKNPAYSAGVRTGDIILAVNGKNVSTNDEVSKIVSQSGGKAVDLSLKRGNRGFSVSFKPEKSMDDGEYKAGLWVRDSTAGIGTVTFYDPQSYIFGGLGHGICDIDTGEIMPLMTGDIVKVNITGVAKGTKGQPGELKGTLDDNNWGSLYSNTETGVFGILNDAEAGKAIPVAMKQEVKTGPAQILATVDNSGPKKYMVQIEKINYSDNAPTKNMVIRVTDPELLKKTGGIVQGMSGCPIIQNGRLVGAVTHVFVNDPEMGYAIFAENMIKTAKILENDKAKDVS